ncbi:calmodulin-binding protein 60 G-like [Neltuma alba]|uniref:calmodulin-binding protein 60 G-like n=1 Tax=Neltuma alba TaxID=207710 RepID=UPI0010A50282|nr:calmodulin-binding protein 60 G-like [Prosopis alba]
MASSGRESHREEGNDKNHQVPGKEGSKRRHGSLRQADIPAIRNIMRGRPTVHDWGLYLEPVLRKVVREEVPPIIHRHLNSGEETLHWAGTSGGRTLRLCFTNRLPATIFTHTRITSEDGNPIGIVLCDARSQNCIVQEGPLSRSRIMMCALKGEFGSNGSEDWSEAEFNANISPRRENKGELLNGEKFITLENGVGVVPDDIHFSDNSSWTRSRRFRLGARAVEHEANIREGRSEAFVVKDKRGQPYEKHDRPLLDDAVWRLKKIAQNGQIHRRLSLYNIKTVRDLLRLYVMNPRSLQEKTGKIAKKSWNTIIEHAKSCEREDDGERYFYQCLTTAQQPIVLVFNSIYELVGVSFDGHNYRFLESLNSEEKCVVETAKRNAYETMETIYESSMKTLAGEPSTSAAFGELIQDEQVGTDQMEIHNTCGGDLVDGLELWNCLSPLPLGLGGNHFEPAYNYLPDLASTSGTGKRKTVWNKIRHAFRLVMPFVARRKAKLSIPCG